MNAHTSPQRAPIVIVGGGIAGMEAALALSDLAADRVELTLIAPDPDFFYKPLVVEEPFTGEPADRHELAPALADIGASYLRGALTSVDTKDHLVALGDGSKVPYDTLIVCIGGRAQPAYRNAETFWSSRSDLPADELIERADRSEQRTLALVVPPGTSWPLPMYELALLFRRRAEELGRPDLRLRLFTPEDAPLIVFGRAASDELAGLLKARRIEFEPESWVAERPDGELHLPPTGELLSAEVVVALPTLIGAAIEGLPADDQSFIPVDEYGRVRGVADVYAAGDGTDFPVKQGGLATQQADAVAEHIAAALGAPVEPAPFTPVLRGQLVTGGESLHMRHQISGGAGEGFVSLDYLWWPPHKVSGRYLSAWLGDSLPSRDLEPPGRPVEIEVSLPHEWHSDPAISRHTAPRADG